MWCGESLIHCITGIDSFSLCMQSRENFLILRASLYECSGLQLIKIACVGYFTGRINMPLLIYFADMIGIAPLPRDYDKALLLSPEEQRKVGLKVHFNRETY